MMGTTTYCPTKENLGEMMLILHAIPERCFLADGFLFEKYLTVCHVSRSVRNQSTPSPIKIP
jgi:hypothetical protein